MHWDMVHADLFRFSLQGQEFRFKLNLQLIYCWWCFFNVCRALDVSPWWHLHLHTKSVHMVLFSQLSGSSYIALLTVINSEICINWKTKRRIYRSDTMSYLCDIVKGLIVHLKVSRWVSLSLMVRRCEQASLLLSLVCLSWEHFTITLTVCLIKQIQIW